MTLKKWRSTPILILSIVVALLLGVVIGWFSHRRTRLNAYDASLNEVIDLVQKHYVDSVDMSSITESLIPDLLHRLDPHSEFIGRDESLAETQRLEGHFYGVGITFNTIIDTPVVVDVIKGGGADRAGIRPGDRILSANKVSLLTDSLTSEEVQKKLRGGKGTVVNVGILRNHKLMNVGITRDDVPIYSINVAYMIGGGVGLIKINGWARNTHQEFISAYAKLKDQGMKKLIIDLRDNVGGYMQSAVQVANEFLPRGSVIVYSEGRAFPKEEYYADGYGLLQDIPLVIMVNELSASSSEIFTGTLQDHDRATVVGRRTFGKGLVQQPFYLPDSSQVRLTVARYYMPSGRSIQKRYTMGDQEGYRRDLVNRIDAGEIYHLDSSFYKTAPKYVTDAGRVVYGESGIMPDFFVPADSMATNSYYIRLIESGLVPEFAFRFSDKNRKVLSGYSSPHSLWQFLRANYTIVEDFANFASDRGIGKRTAMLWDCAPLLDKLLSAQIAQFIMGETGFYEIYFSEDNTISAALKAFSTPLLRK